MICIRQYLSGLLSSCIIIYPLCFYGIRTCTRFFVAMAHYFRHGSIINAPKLTNLSVAQKLGKISFFKGINNISTFQKFNSKYNFVRQTFFHNRYILVQNKDTKFYNGKVYNLSVWEDESYITEIGITHNCRCTATEVLAKDYTKSNSEEAIKKGETATTQIGKTGKNKLEMFRFNPGIEKKVFPPKNAYSKVVGAEKAVNGLDEKTQITTTKHINKYIKDFAEKNPEYFVRGFDSLITTSRKGVNGFSDMNGKIALKNDILKNIMEGINNINNGIKTTFEQEKAISTLHHEIWHNANIPGNMSLSIQATKIMELSNEFVSRKTLGEFMEKLGGKLENEELKNNRDNTGYNKMVRKYDQLIDFSGANKDKLLQEVRNGLINKKYTEQLDVLANAVKNNSSYDIDLKVLNGLIVRRVIDKDYTETDFKTFLNENKNLFKPKGS